MSLITNFKQPTPLAYLAIPRIAVGYHFLEVSWPKLTKGFYSGKILPDQLSKGIGQDPFLWHRHFIESFVIPHSVFFSYLVTFGEIAIGISLVFGCLVRVASLFGAFHNANILLAIALANGGAQLAIGGIFICLHLLFVFSSAGRVFGIDGIFKKYFPPSWLF